MEALASTDEIKDEMIYDIGYLLKTRDTVWTHCDDCKKALITRCEDLSSNFSQPSTLPLAIREDFFSQPQIFKK